MGGANSSNATKFTGCNDSILSARNSIKQKYAFNQEIENNNSVVTASPQQFCISAELSNEGGGIVSEVREKRGQRVVETIPKNNVYSSFPVVGTPRKAYFIKNDDYENNNLNFENDKGIIGYINDGYSEFSANSTEEFEGCSNINDAHANCSLYKVSNNTNENSTVDIPSLQLLDYGTPIISAVKLNTPRLISHSTSATDTLRYVNEEEKYDKVSKCAVHCSVSSSYRAEEKRKGEEIKCLIKHDIENVIRTEAPSVINSIAFTAATDNIKNVNNEMNNNNDVIINNKNVTKYNTKKVKDISPPRSPFSKMTSLSSIRNNNSKSHSKIIIYGNINNHKAFLNAEILPTFISFIYGEDMLSCIQVCPHWLVIITEYMESLCLPLSKLFKEKYSNFLHFECATLKFQPVCTVEKSIRIDWVISAKVLEDCNNHTCQFGYLFSYVSSHENIFTKENKKKNISAEGNKQSLNDINKSKGILYANNSSFEEHRIGVNKIFYDTKYSIDVYNKGKKRSVWIFRDVCRFHGDETQVANTNNVSTVCSNDIIEFAINIFNPFGVVDIHNIIFTDFYKVHFNISHKNINENACPVTGDIYEWFDIDEFQRMSTERLAKPETFAPYLQHIKTEFAGVDVAIRRSEYKAVHTGKIGESGRRAWGILFEVIPSECPIVHSLIRNRLQHDRFNNTMQLRIGDSLIYYLSQGGSNIS